MSKYANIIVDISHEKLDKTFQYLVPKELEDEISLGVLVDIPFGYRTITGYVVELTDEAEFDVSLLTPETFSQLSNNFVGDGKCQIQYLTFSKKRE